MEKLGQWQKVKEIVGSVLERPAAATVEPDILIVEARPEPVTQRHIQIIDVQTGGRVEPAAGQRAEVRHDAVDLRKIRAPRAVRGRADEGEFFAHGISLGLFGWAQR